MGMGADVAHGLSRLAMDPQEVHTRALRALKAEYEVARLS